MFKRISHNPFLGILLTGVIIGLGVGFITSCAYINANEYIQNEMFRLAFSNLRHNINIYVLYFIAGLSILFLGWILFFKRFEFIEKKTIRPFLRMVFIVSSFFYLNWLSQLFFEKTFLSTIQLYLKRLSKLIRGEIPFNTVFPFLKSHLLSFLSFLILIICLSLLFFLFWKFVRRRNHILEKKTLKFVESRFLNKMGLLAILFVLFLNLTVIIDRRLSRPHTPNIIFMCIDALRADHLGYSGYDRNTSPFLDQLAQKNIVFQKNISQSSWTKTSVATFMTSKFQTLYEVVDDEDKLPFHVITLAEVLNNNGYTTVGIVSNPLLKTKFGFHQGFDYYNENSIKTRRVDVKKVCKYISKVKNNAFFLYIHFMDVHSPYEPPSRFKKAFTKNLKGHFFYQNGLTPDISEEDLEYTKGLYNGEIRFVDEKIEQIFDYLEDQKLLKNTVVIINSDHGDEFLEHGGMGHWTTLYNELLHVPLILVPNGQVTATHSAIDSYVRNIDIFPTLLDIANIPIKNKIDGRSLLPAIKGEEKIDSTNIILSRVKSKTKDILLSIFEKNNKYIFNSTKGTAQLFNLENDFGEKNDLSILQPQTASDMLRKIMVYIDMALANREKTKIDKKTLEQLKSLGYIK